ncbi:MAG: CAAX prenyl protease-related protein, partial [Acidobacteriota bacterium]
KLLSRPIYSYALGVLAFWLAMDQWTSKGAQGMPQPLADASELVRYGWIALRVLSGVVATPIAEELAFRGYLLRRFIYAEFENVTDYRSVPLPPLAYGLIGSSLIFGVLHGTHWIAGSLAGAVYGLTMLRRGRIGEAILAHAVTNAGLAAIALVWNRWDLWG